MVPTNGQCITLSPKTPQINPGDYKEVTEVSKNGELVGHTTWHKDKNGNDKAAPYEVGEQRIPSTAKKLKK